MAVIHKGHNELKQKARNYLILAIIFWIPPVLYIIAFTQGFHFEGLAHLFPFLLGGIGTIFGRKYSALRSGIVGEESTSNVLQELPDGYEVFSSVRLTTKDGRAEYDHVIVGENGIFVVEVKNHNGTIEGREEEHSWTQHKVGRKGGEYSSQMRNPVKQVRRQVHILSRYLKDNQLRIWVEGVVYFSNPKVHVYVNTVRTPVFTSSSALSHFLTSYEPRRKIADNELEKVRRLLGNEF